jgi:phenylalanyl-tRNA synthetase alpha chain
MPIMTESKGHQHPISLAISDIIGIFGSMGFEVAEGPEAESEYYNFDTLNIPKHHPARDMWDTFWLQSNQKGSSKEQVPSDKDAKQLLRTHTSPVQVRYMESHKPPFRIIAPGKVYRYEATDATHEAQFYQLEGLVVGKNISLAHLKGTLETFFSKFFGAASTVRMRPSYFPFVEPGVEVDVSCFRCAGEAGKQCSVCKGTGWIEIMGAGLVHPKVLEGAGIDPREWSGFAFGAGIDRLLVLRHGLPDVRLLYSGDLRVTDQF